MQTLTAQQIRNKYHGKYVDVHRLPQWQTDADGNELYEVRKVFSEIHENTTLGQDVGTSRAYTR